MDFPMEAVYGSARKVAEIACRDDDDSYEQRVDVDVDEYGAVEVTRSPRRVKMPSLFDDVPLSPHIDTSDCNTKMEAPTSPGSNSILMDLSDLENSLQDEVDTGEISIW